MSVKSAILLVVLVFALTLLVRLPAGVLTWILPRSIACQSPDGTLWQGGCAQLRSGSMALENVHWTLHPLALLRARLALDVQSGDPRAQGSAQLTLHVNGDMDIVALHAALPVQGGLTPLPAGWGGELDLAIDQADVHARHLSAVQGKITAHSLRVDRPATDLGGFELQFPAPPAGDAPQLGTLRDLGGPLSLTGQLQLRRDGGYELDGNAAPRDSSNTTLQQLLQMLGPAEADGRHPFSIAGTL